MPRNIRSEIFVAMVVIIGLGAAIAFGVFLSSDNPEDQTGSVVESSPTSANTSVSNVETVTTAPDATVTIEISSTAVPEVITEETEETMTSVPDATVTIEFSVTVVPEVFDEETEETPFTESVAQSNTQLSATTTERDATNTPESTVVPRPTRTNTPRPTRTSTLTNTPSPTLTNTNTQTNTFTPSATFTPTRTPRPTEQESILPTPRDPVVTNTPSAEITTSGTPPVSISATSVNSSTINSYGCSAPEGWANYVVQVGNTLFSIAQAVRSTVSELQRVNCLPNPNQIIVGDVLFVPQLPAQPVQTNVPSVVTNPGTNTGNGLFALGCANPAIQITSPTAGQRVSGTFSIIGTATYNDSFGYYVLEIRADNAVTYNFYSRSESPVASGLLGQINAGLFESGVYWVRLLVVDNTGNVREGATCVIPIIID